MVFYKSQAGDEYQRARKCVVWMLMYEEVRKPDLVKTTCQYEHTAC